MINDGAWVTKFARGMKDALGVSSMLVSHDPARQRWNILLHETRFHMVMGHVSDLAVAVHIKEDPYETGWELVMSAKDGLPNALLPETKQITGGE